MITIAMLYPRQPYDLTGPAILARNFVKFRNKFLSFGINPLLCDLGNYNQKFLNNEKTIEDKQLKYHNSAVLKLKRFFINILPKTYIGACFLEYYSNYRKSQKLITERKAEIEIADVLLSQDFYTAYCVSKKYPTKKHVFMMHNSGEGQKMTYISSPKLATGKAHEYLEKIADVSYRKADRLAFISKSAKARFEKDHPEYVNKTIYIVNGVENMRTDPVNYGNPLRLIVVGTVCLRKNQISIINALKIINEKNIYLDIVGSGEEYENCCEFVKTYDVFNVTFSGPVLNSEIPKYFSQANCFISASMDEGLPLSGIEALRSSLPLIMTDVGGCRELIDGNGYLIPPDNQEALVEAIRKMAALSPEERMHMGKRSREIYEQNFGLDALVQSYKDLVDGLRADGLLDERSNT